MNDFAESAQDVKRYIFPDVAEDKTTGIRFIFVIVFNNFACMDNMLDFFHGNISRVATPLRMFCNYVFRFQQLLAYLLMHRMLYIIGIGFCQGVIYRRIVGCASPIRQAQDKLHPIYTGGLIGLLRATRPTTETLNKNGYGLQQIEFL